MAFLRQILFHVQRYATFVFVSVGNLGVWGVFYSYLAQVYVSLSKCSLLIPFRFGVKNYGKNSWSCNGFYFFSGLITGIVPPNIFYDLEWLTFSQYPILSFSINTLNYNFLYPNIGFICLSAILCLLPVYLWSVNKNTKQRKPLLVVNNGDVRGINDSEGDDIDSYDESQGLLPPSRAV